MMSWHPPREYRYIGDTLYMKCSKCGIEKTIDSFPKMKNRKFGVRNDCKECHNKYYRDFHKKNKERLGEYKKKHDKDKSYKLGINWDAIHKKTRYIIDKLGIRPETCSICGRGGKIIAHHPDYNKIYEVVFCCKPCHRLIHEGKIRIKNKDITILNGNPDAD